MLKNAVIALLVLAVVGSVTSVVVYSQVQTAEVEVRVRAKRLADGRTEFAVQQREDGGWSDSLFRSNPRLRADPVVDRWYSSRAVTASALVDVAQLAAARPAPPATWTPLGDTGGDVRIDLDYSVEADVISGALTTVVSTTARGDSLGFEYVKLSLVCDGDALDLIVDDDEYRFSSAPIEVTLRFDGGSPETYSWDYFRGAANGYSPVNDRAFVQRLQAANQVAVQLRSDGATTARLVDLAGFFSTPAQPNLDYCGRSAPSEVSLLQDTRGEVGVNMEYAVSEDLEDGSLTTIIETWITDDSYNMSWLYLVCDRGRLDTIFYISGATSPSRTPVTRIRIDGQPAEDFRWPYMRGVENGYSPDDDLAFLERLRPASEIEVRVELGTLAGKTTFPLAGLLNTRAQGNIDFCGQY